MKSLFISAISVTYLSIFILFISIASSVLYLLCLTLHVEFCPGLSSLLWEPEVVSIFRSKTSFAEPIILVSATEKWCPLQPLCQHEESLSKQQCSSCQNWVGESGPSAKFLVHWETLSTESQLKAYFLCRIIPETKHSISLELSFASCSINNSAGCRCKVFESRAIESM